MAEVVRDPAVDVAPVVHVDLTPPLPGGRYRPALDGVRALSVLAVIVYHLNVKSPGNGPFGLPGGFLAVDVFFVLSGYLITSSLLDELRRGGRLDLVAFYARRALRLLPALLLVLPIATVAALLTTPRPTGIVAGAVYAITYTTDFAATFHAATGLLTPTWSLAVEEQYYLLWPLALLLLPRSTRRLGYVAAMVAVTCVATEVGYQHLGHDNYYAPWTHAAALLVGSALAMMIRSHPDRLRAVGRLGWVGGVALAVLIVHPPDDVSLNGGDWLLVAVLAALLLLHVELERGSRVSRALGCGPLRWVGRRSYGMYLFSAPITWALISRGWPLAASASLAVVATLAVSALSFRYVETPALRHKQRFVR